MSRPNIDLSQPLADQDYHFKVYRWDYRYYSFHLPYTENLPREYSLRHLIAEYYGLTSWVDDTVGRMITAVREAGLAEDTIIVFTSDHGDNLGSNGLVQKGGPNEESIRIPLVFRIPGRYQSNGVSNGRISALVDIAPTLLDLAGIEIPAHFHGRSLLNNDIDDYLGDSAIIETDGGVAVRSERYLYHLPYRADRRTLAAHADRIYDLKEDPYQMNNLALPANGDLENSWRNLDRKLRHWDQSTPWMH